MTEPLPPPADLDVVRTSYDAVAEIYVAMGMGELDPEPWLRAALDVFAEQVRDVGPVLDAGCGSGQVTAYLASRGVEVWGIDLSPQMVGHARRRFPALTFEIGSVTDVDLVPESLGGILGWWSWFNLPRDVMAQVVARTATALRAGGRLLLGTHVGDGDVERTSAYGGVPVRWTTHLYRPEELVTVIEAAGLQVDVELRVPPTSTQPRPQVVVMGRRP